MGIYFQRLCHNSLFFSFSFCFQVLNSKRSHLSPTLSLYSKSRFSFCLIHFAHTFYFSSFLNSIEKLPSMSNSSARTLDPAYLYDKLYTTSMKNTVRVGLVQMRCGPDKEKNIAKACTRILQLAKKGANIICLPELFATRYFCQTRNKKFFAYAEATPGGRTWKKLSEMAQKVRSFLIVSLFEKTKDQRFFNTALVIDNKGRHVAKYRKMHIPDDAKNHYGETFYFQKGDMGFQAVKTTYATIGVQVCFDQWFPEGARILASKGAQILFYPTAIGFPIRDASEIRKAEYKAWHTIQQSHAIANGVFVVCVNRVGREDHLNFWGSSFVCDPYGRWVALGPKNKEADIVASCQLSLIDKKRKDWPFLECRRIKI